MLITIAALAIAFCSLTFKYIRQKIISEPEILKQHEVGDTLQEIFYQIDSLENEYPNIEKFNCCDSVVK